MSYFLPELPYDYDALEPYIDSETMKLHHQDHHASYVENLNFSLERNLELQNLPLDALLVRLAAIPEKIRTAIRNNAGGHLNHLLFWRGMKRNGGYLPDGELADAINSSFGSFVEFKSKFTQAAVTHFGAGWAWLCYREGELGVTSTMNQDNPLTLNQGEPLLGLDLWEHAYYLRYRSRRRDYIEGWWNVVNWEQVGEHLAAAKAMGRVFGFPITAEQASESMVR